MKNIIYIQNPSRAHKILPLLEGAKILVFERMTQFFQVRQYSGDHAVVLIDSFGRYAIKGLLISLVYHLPLIVRLRGNYFKERKEVYDIRPSILAQIKLLFQYWLGNACIRRSSLVIANSLYLKNVVLQGYPNKDVVVVYNPYTQENSSRVELNISLPEAGFHLLSITNFNLRSKVDLLLQAITGWLPVEMWEKYDIYWIICGVGPLAEEFKREIDKMPYMNRIIYLGYVNNTDPLYQWSNLFVHLTELDAFPNVTLDAMAHELPVLTNDLSCGTLEQIHHGINGMIVCDADELLSAIDYYHEDDKRIFEHGREGRKLVIERFSVAAQLINMNRIMSEM